MMWVIFDLWTNEIIFAQVLCEVTDDDIPPELIERFEKDKTDEENLKKEKQDAHLYQNVFVSCCNSNYLKNSYLLFFHP